MVRSTIIGQLADVMGQLSQAIMMATAGADHTRMARRLAMANSDLGDLVMAMAVDINTVGPPTTTVPVYQAPQQTTMPPSPPPQASGSSAWELAGLADTAEKATQTAEDRQGVGDELPTPRNCSRAPAAHKEEAAAPAAAPHKPPLEEDIPAPRTLAQVQEAQSAQAAPATRSGEKERRGRTFGEANGLDPKVTSSFGVAPPPGTVLTMMTYCALPTVTIRQMRPQPDKKLTAAMKADLKSDHKRDAKRDWWAEDSWP